MNFKQYLQELYNIEAGQASDAQPHDDHFAQRVEAGALEIVAQPRAERLAQRHHDIVQLAAWPQGQHVLSGEV